MSIRANGHLAISVRRSIPSDWYTILIEQVHKPLDSLCLGAPYVLGQVLMIGQQGSE